MAASIQVNGSAKRRGEHQRKAVAENCVSLKALTEKDYWAEGNRGGRQPQVFQLAR
jgi:hypothetical protein